MNTLDLLFSWFLAATVRGALLALAVLALRAALRGRLPARWHYALWLPMIFVLVAPSLPRSRWSLENRFLRPAPHAVKVSLEEGPDFTVAPALHATGGSSPKAAPAVDWRRLLELGWLAGGAGMLVFVLTAYARTMRRIRRGAVESEPGLPALLTSVARVCGLRRLPRLIVSTEVRSPAVTGFLRPTLLLPAGFPGAFTENEAQLILLHELTHLKRHDLPQNWLFGLLQALHWCNPILWFAFNRIREDREAACDAEVLTTASGDQRADYGHALLKLEGVLAYPGLSLGFVGIFERSAGMRSRVRAIAAHQPSHPAWSVLGAALILVLALAGATRAQNGAETDAKPAVPAPASAGDSNPSAKRQEIERKLREIIIPKVDIREMPFRDALTYLATRSTELDPAKTGVQIVTGNAPASALKTPLTVALNNIPLGEALLYITNLAELRFTIEDDGVHFRPRDVQPDELVTKEWPWTPELKAAIGYDAGTDLIESLLSDGIPFPTGASAQMSPDGNKLIVKNTQPFIDRLEQLIHPPAANATANHGPITSQAEVIRKKLATIIIPRLDLREATIREAINFLKQKSLEFDPAKEGVNIVLRLDAPNPIEPGPALGATPTATPFTTPITTSFRNVPLGEALKDVTTLAGLKFKIEDYAVKIVPMNYGVNDLITREWAVTPEMMSALGYKAPGKTKDALTAHGITFPRGATAAYLERSQKLIMKNSSENIDLLDAVLSSAKPANKTDAPAAQPK